jgi:hypothetical protein
MASGSTCGTGAVGTNQGGGPGPSGDYCADPATGRPLATSPLPDLTQDQLMTVAGQRVDYSAPAGSGFQIRTVPVPAACGQRSSGSQSTARP